MTNINNIVWKFIDADAGIQKNLLGGLINTSALARKIAKEHHLQKNIDAIITAIRRYEHASDKKQSMIHIYDLFKKAKISTTTKLASVLVKKNSETRKKLGELYKKIDVESGHTLRIFEVSSFIKIIIDETSLASLKDFFAPTQVVSISKHLGELSINYQTDITKVPGLFATLCHEIGSYDISIIDSMICHTEHIIIVQEQDLENTFKVVFSLTKG